MRRWQVFERGLRHGRRVRAAVLILDKWGGEGICDFVEKALTLTVDRRQKAQVPTIITLNLAADAGDVATEQLVELFGPSLADRLRGARTALADLGQVAAVDAPGPSLRTAHVGGASGETAGTFSVP